MSSEWNTVLLGELCKFTKGSSPTQKTLPGDYPLIVTGPEPLSSSEFQFEGEAVCVPMVSSTGHGHASLKRVHYANGRFAVANIVTACEVKNPEKCSTRFLHIYLQHFKDELIVPRMQGTANVSLSQRELAKVPVTLPPLGEQHRIVDLIGFVDASIECAEEALGALVGLVRSRREFAMHEAAVARIASAVFQITMGRQRSPQHASGENMIPYLRSANVQDGQLDMADVNFMNFTPREQQKYCLELGDVLVTEGSASQDAVGAAALWNGELSGVVGFQNTLLRFRALRGITTPGFVFHWCRWAYESGAFREAASGTSILHIGSKRAEQMLVKVPDLSRQEAIVDELNAFESVVSLHRGKIESLKTLRSELLSALLSGAHRIPETYDELMGADSMETVGA